MDDEEIRRQIGEMSKQGLHGFLIHPRQGMEVPYLSEMYFEKVRTAVEAAKERQMEVWLYDEFPYPSGISGGKVTLEHPEYACLELTKTCQVCHGGETARVYGPWGRVIFARAYRLVDGRCRWDEFVDLKDFVGSGYVQDVFQMSGLTKYNKKRFFQGELSQFLCWNVPEGDWKIYLYTEVVMKHFKYFENFIDPLNPDAVKCFLETTHDKYRQYIGDEFGKTVKGVFTDEVTAFPPFHPWSVLLPGLVRQQSGLELTEYLPALTENMGEITDRVRYAYWNAATEQFIESWDKQVYRWCEQNQLLYIGEKPILRSKELAYVHVPGIDAGHQKFGSRAVLAEGNYRANGKVVSSAAHFYKKPAALCEAFHSIGWGMTIQDAKWIFDWLTVMGIDWFITHGAYYTTDGLKKHDAPPSSFYQMPWWKDVHELTDYVERLNGVLTAGTRHVSVLLLDPITSTWTETDQRLAVLNEEFAEFQNELLRSGVDYYIMDPRLFAEGTIRETEEGTQYENCGDSYKLVVLPFMTNLEAGAVRNLEEYVQKGGMLLAAGTLPYENLEGYEYEEWTAHQFQKNPSKVREQFFQHYAAQEHGDTDGVGNGDDSLAQGEWNKNCYFSMDYHGVVQELCRLEQRMRVWQVRKPCGGEVLQIQSRGDDGQERLFLVNLDAESHRVEAALGGIRMEYELAGGQSLLLDGRSFERSVNGKTNGTVNEATGGDADETVNEAEVLALDTGEQLPMNPVSANLLRIGTWRMTLSDGQTAQVDSIPVIDQLEAAGMRLPIRQKDYFGCPKELDFVPVHADYAYEFQNHLPGTKESHIYLVMEPGTMEGTWHMKLNETTYGPEDFRTHPFYLPTNLAADVTDSLTEGKNCLRLSVDTDVSFGGIRNPLYLCGDFAVNLGGGIPALEPPQKTGCLRKLASCGLPYYSGTVKYTKDISDWMQKRQAGKNTDGEEGYVHIRIQDTRFHEAVRMKIGDTEVGTCAFAPYEWTVPESMLEKCRNITVCVDTTLSRLFEGEYFDEERHEYRQVTEE